MRLNRIILFCMISCFSLMIAGCGSGSDTPAASEASKNMSPEDVQKEIQKLSPPVAAKGKTKKK